MLTQKEVDALLIGVMGEDFHRPCGFCGSENCQGSLSTPCFIYCVDCGAQGPLADTTREAWIKWNMRSDNNENN